MGIDCFIANENLAWEVKQKMPDTIIITVNTSKNKDKFVSKHDLVAQEDNIMNIIRLRSFKSNFVSIFNESVWIIWAYNI